MRRNAVRIIPLQCPGAAEIRSSHRTQTIRLGNLVDQALQAYEKKVVHSSGCVICEWLPPLVTQRLRALVNQSLAEVVDRASAEQKVNSLSMII